MNNRMGKKLKNKTLIIVILLLIAAMAAMISAWQFSRSEEKRETLVWQSHLSLVLNGRSDVLSKWINKQKEVIELLSQNSSVQLYFTNLNNDMGLDRSAAEAMKEYLLPLLSDRALENGYISSQNEAGYQIKANIEKHHDAGIALTDAQGQIITSTLSMPTVPDDVKTYLSKDAVQNTHLIGPYMGENGLPTVAIIAPIFAIDGDQKSGALGFVIAIRMLGNEFFELLKQPGETVLTANNYLIVKKDGMIHYIQNIRETDPDYQPSLSAETPLLAAEYAYENPGKMGVMMNSSGEWVLVSGKMIDGTNWMLVRTIDRSEALSDTVARKRNILIISFLIIISFAAILVLVWRHSISVRLEKAVRKQKALLRKYENLSEFMSIVTNSQPSEITAVDENGHYTFVNSKAATMANSRPEDMIGKQPSAILGRAKVRIDEVHCEKVLTDNKIVSEIRNVGPTDNPKTIKASYIPMLISDGKAHQEKGVLIIKDDITEIEQNRLKRELGLKSLVSTLTMIIASRDPYSAAHSQRVVAVTKILSAELQVDDTTSATAELAGAMMNLGKILVPREILTKPTNLTREELTTIRSSMLKSADLVQDIEFEGPVAETLRQMQAHWDGSGQPSGLSGEDILLSARIVSVANAFVGMISMRAHRQGMEMNKAVQILMNDADRIYDRRPVIALMNYLENKNGYSIWADFSEPPADVG
ncbi:MAG: HD domain-containing phosphohydrolase [Emcibacteraceae bacterium]